MSQNSSLPGLKDWLSLLALIVLWGSSFMFISLSLTSFSPLGIVALRVLLGAMVLIAVLFARGLRFPRALSVWVMFLLFGLLGNLLPFYLISVGQQQVSSGIAGLLMAVMPLTTMLLAHYLLVGESLNRFKVLGFCLGLSGVAIILSPSLTRLGQGESKVFSSLLILLATFSYALNSVLIRRLPRLHPVISGAGSLLMASLIAVPIWLLRDLPWQQHYSQQAILSLLWLGIGPTGLATLLYFAVIGSAGPTFLSYINYVIPAFAYFVGALVLHEAIEWHSLVALLLIIAGIALTRRVSVNKPLFLP